MVRFQLTVIDLEAKEKNRCILAADMSSDRIFFNARRLWMSAWQQRMFIYQGVDRVTL